MPKRLQRIKSLTIPLLTALTVFTAPSALAELVVNDAWIRAMPPTQTMTAGYATLVNEGPTPITITGVSSDIAPMATLHTTVQADDSVSMVALPTLELAPDAHFSFVPGGAHIMLMQMPSMPSEGAVAQICFNIDGAEAHCTEATVRRNAPAGQGMDMNNHDMHHGHHGD